MINIDELHNINTRRLKNRLKIYDDVLKKCHIKIKKTAHTPKGSTFCFYIMPNYVFGIPLYDLNHCIIYLVKKLSENGFYVAYTHPNLLYISWFNRNNSIEYNNKDKDIKKEENYKKINTFKTKNFIYNNSSLNSLNKKTNQLDL